MSRPGMKTDVSYVDKQILSPSSMSCFVNACLDELLHFSGPLFPHGKEEVVKPTLKVHEDQNRIM